jgi:hypothetical protein
VFGLALPQVPYGKFIDPPNEHMLQDFFGCMSGGGIAGCIPQGLPLFFFGIANCGLTGFHQQANEPVISL